MKIIQKKGGNNMFGIKESIINLQKNKINKLYKKIYNLKLENKELMLNIKILELKNKTIWNQLKKQLER